MEFKIEGAIKPKQRPRLGKRGVYTPKSTHDSEKAIAYAFKKKYPKYKLSEKAFGVIIKIFTKKPKKPKRFYPSTFDIDNIAKTVLDALNGVIWKDDVQVITLLVQKTYSTECDYTEVFVDEIL